MASYQNDMELTFMSAMLYAAEGKSPSLAIEDQERRGQQDVVRNQRLPRKWNITACSSADAKDQYEKMGIVVAGEYDDLFFNVSLPEGWEIRATGSSYWNNLYDARGRLRAKFFYKAAFYDRDAHIVFECRYRIRVEHTAPDDAEWEVWEASDIQGTVLDGDSVVRETERVTAPEKKNGRRDFNEESSIKRRLWDELESYMKQNYPEYEDINAYWD